MNTVLGFYFVGLVMTIIIGVVIYLNSDLDKREVLSLMLISFLAFCVIVLTINCFCRR